MLAYYLHGLRYLNKVSNSVKWISPKYYSKPVNRSYTNRSDYGITLTEEPFCAIEGGCSHYCDAIMISIASQITSLTIVYSCVYSGVDKRKHQSSASLAFVCGIHRWPVNSPPQSPSNAENVSISWCHHVSSKCCSVSSQHQQHQQYRYDNSKSFIVN